MSNWQQQNHFNLNAPEFVPKFGNEPPINQQQSRNNAQESVLPPGSYMNQNLSGQSSHQQTQPPYYQQHPQQYIQQQQYRQPYYQQQQHQQYQQQNIYYQPQQNQQSQSCFYKSPVQQSNFNNSNQSLSNPTATNTTISSINKQTATNNASFSGAAADKSVDQVTKNVSKLSTSVESPTEPAQSTLTIEQANKPISVAKSSSSASLEDDSVVVEKSTPSQVETIKEDEEWDKENELEDNEGDEEIKSESTETIKPKKKTVVVREFKSRKEPINVIFCGHVDAGKSTIGGQIMFLTGMVDKRTLEKYEREAKEKNRESWYLSWALDTNLEEREKGKTVEVGRAFFETEKKHFIILDAPGHRGFVPNMIGGASQADIAVLVISARRGEFETGFEKGGQTREHAMLVKTAGVRYLIILVNKMDDPTVNWDVARYNEIKDKLTPYVKKCGFQPGKDTFFMPCSGFTGAFIKEPIEESICPWYRGPCFIEYMDGLPTMNRTIDGPFRMPIVDKYKDMGTVVLGKIESGMIKLNDKLTLMPNKVKVEVTNIYCEEDETDSAICGENVKIKLKGVEEEEISSGFVLCDLKDLCQVSKVFDAQVVILECPSIICPGFNSIMHIHASTVEVQLKTIIGTVDKKTGDKDLKNRPRFIKQDQIAICRFEIMGGSVVCMEPFKLFPQLGRFTLRYENKTVAVGKVLKVIE